MRAKLFLIYMFTLVLNTQLFGQQFPYIRTTNNLYDIANPATLNNYYLVNGGLPAKWSVHGFGRKSWLGFDGSPNTGGVKLNFNNSDNNNVRMGIGILNDSYGAIANTSGFFRFAYDIKFQESLKLLPTKGLSIGFGYFHSRYSFNLDDVTFVDPRDPFQQDFSIDNEPANIFSLGLSGYFNTKKDKIYLGLSSMLIPSTINEQLFEEYQLKPHFYANLGIIRKLNKDYSLEIF